jgi:hypothetical protein
MEPSELVHQRTDIKRVVRDASGHDDVGAASKRFNDARGVRVGIRRDNP